MKLSLEGINKTYGQKKALQNFSYTFTPGIYALLGPNGSGKSTLMNIITGNLDSDSGSIAYTDTTDGEQNEIRDYQKSVGYMPQHIDMYKDFKVTEFLYYMAALKAISRDEAGEQITAILEKIDLADIKHKRIKTLSGGMKQRLCLAQAVLGNPKILILDEPTAGLDPMQRIALKNFIAKFAFDRIVIIATHIVSDIEYIARDIIFLKRGVIIDSAPPPELADKIQGSVWSITVPEVDAVKYQTRYNLIGISKTDAGVSIRILSDTKPHEDAVPVRPTLEDYYLHIFGN
ncbi:MAG: ATP-binding cassette domain-containing protein [Eubacteriales bacterium]